MKKALFISVILLSAVYLRAQAQDSLAVMRLEIETMKLEIERMKLDMASMNIEADAKAERTARLDRIVSKLPTISGFVNLRYQWNGQTEANSFDVRRARLDVKGDIGTKVGYRLQVEFAGTPRILDAYVTWKMCEWVGMQAGQFKVPFSLENPYSPVNLETMDNSLVIMALAGYADVANIAANGRDIGLGFNGNFLKRDGFSIINWALGVFDGAGINRVDNNKQKDFSGILTINPIKNLSLAAYHYNGWGFRELNGEIPAGNFRRIRSGGGVKYDDGRWLARSEYIWGKTGGLHSQGAYVVAGWFAVPQKVQIAAKYDYFQRDLTNSDTRWNYYTAGVTYVPIKYCKLQLNYSYRTSPGFDSYHYVGAQVFGIF